MDSQSIFQPNPVFSLEVFPPQAQLDNEGFNEKLAILKDINPDFISVTFGAGGQINNQNPLKIADLIQQKSKITAMAHITGLYQSQPQLSKQLAQLKKHHITKILAIRGDYRNSSQPLGDFRHADELIAFIKGHGDFEIAGACYPQNHPESKDTEKEFYYLKQKIKAGLSFLISQMVFNNENFYHFQNQLAAHQIQTPVEVGIMPCTSKKQLQKITHLTGHPIPAKLTTLINYYQSDSKSMRQAGIEFAIQQIIDLSKHHVAGIHLFTMNDVEAAKSIWDATRHTFKS
ncbi:hypothetical protein BGL34_03115 [Fructilactobacillus lindneri]|uniref:Methylenetetrahydrofolate reductase n=2 Tax=Fructilactobacillus lindneri TaxID=53444 RepID=A0A0R2JWM2_9LACO|nr:methylenetetrahydrofolate reductase [Fructilactobacillus lindneri]ANZ57878.1 hypothetical protein AYR60_03415 [Fructilactobacillus lindneri]ANZ59147.1 hypothetical protein AYR59_03415 [Fructilactobacillus lindneri]KRN78660.1 5,10-methylenetetrahydrofolate reductase [Fructilactobacillus lindneri DSM 20690 = JCM 11027]POG98198.1 hypothetical protein BGL31_03745 [Fructilactobacillus lindneri]POH01685.1 hypothetical protein BGL32_03685 [Fructilactobacillus lindneri]